MPFLFLTGKALRAKALKAAAEAAAEATTMPAGPTAPARAGQTRAGQAQAGGRASKASMQESKAALQAELSGRSGEPGHAPRYLHLLALTTATPCPR